jgi:hypothetical protein
MLHHNEIDKYYDRLTKSVILDNEYTGDLTDKVLPKDIKTIFFERKTLLNLTKSFNRTIDYLPDCLISLYLSEGFNQEITKLPKKLEILAFGSNYDISLNNTIFPENLKEIHFGTFFNQNIDKLPDTIQHITLGSRFNKVISKFPKSLNSLTIENNYISLDNLPITLKKFTTGYGCSKSLNNLPDSIEEINILNYSCNITKFPKELKKLTISHFNKKIGCYEHEETKLMIPEGIFYLSLGSQFNQELDDLPQSLTYLDLSKASDFNKSLDCLPLNLEILEISSRYNKTISNLPPGIKKIIIFNENQKKLITKIPFDCEIILSKSNIEEKYDRIGYIM